MKLWTVYDNPLDVPGMYVAREFDITDVATATEVHFAAIDLSEVRVWIIEQAANEGLLATWLPAQKDDDPCILETWI